MKVEYLSPSRERIKMEYLSHQRRNIESPSLLKG